VKDDTTTNSLALSLVLSFRFCSPLCYRTVDDFFCFQNK
jgi:hypothetical protein